MKDLSRQFGFTLIELAVVLTVSGLMLGGVIKMAQPYVMSVQRSATQEKLEKISDALALYAQNYGRLPCPGNNNPTIEPFGAPRNSGAAGDDYDNDCGALTDAAHIGIVPFRALGLKEDDVIDAYGNLITYAVTPALAGAPVGTSDVHDMCRTSAWVQGGANLNLKKARVCCILSIAPFGSPWDVRVSDPAGAFDTLYLGVHDHTGSDYGDPDTVLPVGTVPDNTNVFIAFALVSHGENGDGAFLSRTAGQIPATADPGSNEPINHDNDLGFVSVQLSRQAGVSYFDDIVLWRLNTDLYSEFGNDSCQRP